MAEDRAVVWITHKGEECCADCGAEIFRGAFIQITRETGIRCLECAGFAGLVFLPSGDPALTRRATALSTCVATVVKFSKTRKRNERQGVLVEETAFEAAKRECGADASLREAQRHRRRIRDEAADRTYIARFAEKILELYPSCPPSDADAIARHACEKHSGRVGRTAAAKQLDPKAIALAVRAYIRHRYTTYDDLLAEGHEPFDARPQVAQQVNEILCDWKEGLKVRAGGATGGKSADA